MTVDRQSPTPEFTGQLLDGRYELEARLGRGAMGVVYRAQHRLMKKAVAVKMLHPEVSEQAVVVERFFREARAASSIDHPNICSATDFGQTDDGTLYLVMEYLEGHTLKTIIHQHAPLSAPRVVTILAQVASALSRAHSLGIIHRDLKPDNIFLVARHGQQDVVKILDFGLAQVHLDDEEREDAKITLAGEVFGTPKYMAPEQAQGDVVDHRADLYAVGVMAFEMLTGEPPFKASSAMQLLWQQAMKKPPTMGFVAPEVVVPLELEEIVMTLLEKGPDARFADATALLHALQRLSLYDPSCLSLAPVTDVHPRIDSRAQGESLMTIMTTAVPHHGPDHAPPAGRDTIAMMEAPAFAELAASQGRDADAATPNMDTEPPISSADTSPPVVTNHAVAEHDDDETLLVTPRVSDSNPRPGSALAEIKPAPVSPPVDSSPAPVTELPLKKAPTRSFGPNVILIAALLIGVVAAILLVTSSSSDESADDTPSSRPSDATSESPPPTPKVDPPSSKPVAPPSFATAYQALRVREDLEAPVNALAAEDSEARAEALASIAAIAQAETPMSPAMQLLLVQAHARGGKDDDAVGLLDGLLVRHRELMDDPLVLDTMMLLFSRKGEQLSKPAQNLVSTYYTEAIAERLFDAALFGEYLIIRRRAHAMLEAKGVIATLAEWQQVSLALRRLPKGKCFEMRPLVDQLTALGEPAALPVVEAIYQEGQRGCGPGGARPCHGCMTENLQAAFSVLKSARKDAP